ncbi:hypothetical protein [Capnocytophaga canimorsus]|uniref:hypothetical protein n=1 Tax=Capnocytophaga canimorsus TaxID=28188 RepID=UPI0028E9CE0E|nr:hypothetical protein [Capnocytophaga canimorsus]MDT9499163.1 hypothetical protein [Capnocytophaga canimorsus]
MKHLESYTNEIAERLKKVKGVRKLRTLVDTNALFFSFSMRDLSVFNEIDKVIPPNYYIQLKKTKQLLNTTYQKNSTISF